MRSRWAGLGVALVSALASALMWSRLPERVATHWNMRGEVDGWSSRGAASITLPVMIVALWALFQLLPLIDPRRANYEKFRDAYWLVANSVLGFTAVIHIAMLAFAIGAPVDLTRVAGLGIAALFIILGNYLGRVRPNWFIGIRTPWTLESPEVWRKTHRLAGWLFVLAGIVVGAITLIPGTNAMQTAVVAVGVAAVASALASLAFWYQEKHQ